MHVYDKLVDLLLDDIGDYDPATYSITLYDVENVAWVHQAFWARMNTVTTKYRYLILSPYEKVTNVKILDIGL